MEGGHDPGCRAGFPWDERLWDHELRDYVKSCIGLRRAYPALRRGDFSWLFHGQGVVAFSRRLGDELLVVLMNSKRQPVTLDVPVAGLQEGARLRHVLPGGEVSAALPEDEVVVRNGALPGIRVPGRSGVVLARGPGEG
jgi:glycosidase